MMTRIAALALTLTTAGLVAAVPAADAATTRVAHRVVDQTATLTAHNTVRSNVAAAESARLHLNVSIPALTWNTAAASNAQTWADSQLPIVAAGGDLAHNPNLDAMGLGENAYFEAGFGAPSIGRAVDSWASEAADYHYDTNSCTGVCGHYTQLVWANTTSVGCGIATDGNATIVFCDYAPPGNFVGELPYVGTPLNAPPNDNIANESILPFGGGTLAATNAGATKEPGEPNHGGNVGGKSIWYAYAIPGNTTVEFDTCGSDFDTLLAVYDFHTIAMDSLTLRAQSDDACGPTSVGSRVLTANPAATSKYVLFAVDGWGGASGNIQLNWHPVTTAAAIPLATSEAQRLTQIATFLGVTPSGALHDGVQFLAFLNGLAGSDLTPTPWTPLPAGSDQTVNVSWAAADLPTIATATTLYQVSEIDAHRLAFYFLSFLLALSGH